MSSPNSYTLEQVAGEADTVSQMVAEFLDEYLRENVDRWALELLESVERLGRNARGALLEELRPALEEPTLEELRPALEEPTLEELRTTGRRDHAAAESALREDSLEDLIDPFR
jgi:hypothetical protein